MSSKHFKALEDLFASVEEEIGASAGPKTCEALGNARAILNEGVERDRRRSAESNDMK